MKENNDRNQVKVLTAGGVMNSNNNNNNNAATPTRKNKKNKKKKNQASTPSTGKGTETATSPSVATDMPAFAIKATTANTATHTQQPPPPEMEFEHSETAEDVEDPHSSQQQQHQQHEPLLPPVNEMTSSMGGYRDNDATTSSGQQRGIPTPGNNKGVGVGVVGGAVVDPEKEVLFPPDHPPPKRARSDLVWLLICFFGIMASFVAYGLLMEYATSGGRQLHELSFLFVTSGLYTMTAAAGRYVRDETPTTIPPARFAVLGLTSMGSTFFSVRSLRYVIYPIQVLAKSCKPVPVMLMGAVLGKKYPLRKYVNVLMIVMGVALFMSGGKKKKHSDDDDPSASPNQLIGIVMLFVSLCFDGGTGAYEDKLMSVHSVQPFDLMYNIQLGKTILAGIGLIVLNELHLFLQLVQDMGFLLVALGLSGALGQVFIFVTIAKFGALTCSIIGLFRKVTTLVASIYFYGHSLNSTQFLGLVISIGSMVFEFWGKKKGKGKHHGGGEGHAAGDDHHNEKDGGPQHSVSPLKPDELQRMLSDDDDDDDEAGDVELAKPGARATSTAP